MGSYLGTQCLTFWSDDKRLFRIWLAYHADGKPKIEPVLEYGLLAKTAPTLVSSSWGIDHRKAAVTPATSPTPPGGDDYPLDYHEDGYPQLPECLRRKPDLKLVVNPPKNTSREAAA